jgi:N-acetylglucosaminyldiphosphoundecaprenol N-acetyl-beta-D-mannosaminyltransferase
MADFDRNVHCVMGLPIDAMPMEGALRKLQDARATRTKCFFSTPNLNFLIASQKQVAFRESVCMSDLSLPDGMPLVWVAKLLNIPIHERVSGSDLFDRLRAQTEALWRVFFFGGPKGVGQDACLAIGNQAPGIVPTGYIYPGFVNSQEMSRDDLIHCINRSASDLVVVSLGAAKGQDWICRNRQAIDAPVIGHLGAVINFVAGSVQRAPRWMQRSGLEWLWRAKEESSLIRRYFGDGLNFLRLLATRVLPLAFHAMRHKPSHAALGNACIFWKRKNDQVQLMLRGAWSIENLKPLRNAFTRIEQDSAMVVLNMAEVECIDSAFVGLLLLLDQSQRDRNLTVRLVGVTPSVRRYLKLSCVGHLVVE